MGVDGFEFNLSFPQEQRYLAMLRDVVASAARQSGCGDLESDAFAKTVEEAAGTTPPGADDRVAVVVRHADGAVHVELGTGDAMRSLSVRT
jgi:hypothetical protein